MSCNSFCKSIFRSSVSAMLRRPETACEHQAAAVMAQLVSAALTPTSPEAPIAENQANANDKQKSTRQRYVAVACDFCKKRHSRCDAIQPRCSLCSRFNEECTYETEMKKKGRKKRSLDENGADLSHSSPSSPFVAAPSGLSQAGASPGVVGAPSSTSQAVGPRQEQKPQPLGMALVHSLGQQVTTFDRKSLTEVRVFLICTGFLTANQFMDAFTRCHFSGLLFGVEIQGPNEPWYEFLSFLSLFLTRSSHTSGNRILSDCCRSSRQFLASAALATGTQTTTYVFSRRLRVERCLQLSTTGSSRRTL